MQRFIILLSVISLISCSQPKADHFSITAKAPGIYNGMRAYLKVKDNRGRLINKDTAIVMDETFSFRGVREQPSLEYLHINGYKGSLPLIVENGTMDILIHKDSLNTSEVSGSKTNSDLKNYLNQEKALANQVKSQMGLLRAARKNGDTMQITELNKSYNQARADFMAFPVSHVEGHEGDMVSLMMLYQTLNTKRISLDDLEKAYKQLSPELQASGYGIQIKGYIATQKRILEQQKATQIGGTAPNFSAKTPEGDMLALNDIKGKVTIIDFWASWCGPCRRENPNVVKVYEKYHDKGLEIIGVSLDKTGQKNRWLKAIEDDKLPWHQISNLQGWKDPIAKTYGVRAIPATFILDAEGKIIAKNLRGSALEAKMAELLN